MKSFVIILIGFSVSWYFTDISFESAMASILAPFLMLISFISFSVWLVLLFHRKGISQTASRGGVIGSSGDSGGDC